jgi:S1-C subfamily serine protease
MILASRRSSALLLSILGASFSILEAACGGAGAPPAAPNAKLAGDPLEREREVASPRSCIGKQRLLEALGSKDTAEAPKSGREKYRTDPLAASVSPSEAYRIAAPSTVIIRTRDGLGSGVVVDAAAGLVLTNHHVAFDVLQPDLTMNVSLEIAEVEPTGRVKRSGKTYEGTVVKADAVKDLALIRIKNPPKGLTAVKLSAADPQVGESVVSIGHAGIGLLWAAKVCNVSGIGDQTRDTSVLEVGDCKIRDLSDSESESKRREEQCEARKRQIREEIASSTQGLAVQTSCNITHGDSGGPLLSARGELLGLNQSLRFDAATVAFHVHVAELRAFLKDVPAGAVQVVPDPWCEGGSEATVEDLDGDGKKETVKLVGNSVGHGSGFGGAEATFVDLDQDDDAGKRTKDRPFDADIATLRHGEDLFVFYDTDGDGRWDVLLRDKEADGDVEVGWRWSEKTARFEEDKSLAGKDKKPVDVMLLAKAEQRQRLGAVAQALGWSKLSSEATLAVAENVTVPDPFAGSVQNANASSMGTDKREDKPIAVHAYGPSGDLMIIDTRSEALAALKSGDDARTLVEKRLLKPEFVTVGRPNGRWAMYDTDGDGKLDLALFAKNPSDKDEHFGRMASFTTDAFDLRDGGGKKLPQFVGRSIMRPSLLVNEKAKKAAQMMGMGMAGNDEGRGSFPKPIQAMVRAPWAFGELGGQTRRTLERLDKSSAVAMVDLDGDSKDLATKSADDLVRQQQVDWEIAFYRIGKLLWAYYDTDGDGAYDVVLFTRDASKGNLDAAFTLSKSGDKVTHEAAAKGSVFQPERVAKDPKRIAALREVYTRVVESANEGDDGKGKGKGKAGKDDPSKGAPPGEKPAGPPPEARPAAPKAPAPPPPATEKATPKPGKGGKPKKR